MSVKTVTSATLAEIYSFITPLREIRDTIIATAALPLDPARQAKRDRLEF